MIFEDSLFDLLLNDPNPNVALVAKYESWMDGTMVRLDKENNIINFVPKKAFRYEDTDLYYKTVNVYKLLVSNFRVSPFRRTPASARLKKSPQI